MSRAEKRKHKEFLSQLEIAPTYPNLDPYPTTGERRVVVRKGHSWPSHILEDGYYPYTITPDGEFRLTEQPRPTTQMHHPEICNGRDVIAAGMVKIVNGEIHQIDNESGHYRPSEESVLYAMQVIGHWDIPTSDDLKISGIWSLLE